MAAKHDDLVARYGAFLALMQALLAFMV